MPHLPSGTVTFLFSDIEGSTALLKQLGDDGYAAVLATHRRLVRETFAAHDGQEIDTQGDAFFYSFPRARAAVAAAVAVQRAHEREAWPDGASVRVRLGLHTGEPAVGEEGYTGLDVVRASRIAAVGRGGQVLLSESTRAIVADDLPDGVELRSLGDRQLKDIERPEPLHELQIDGVQTSPEATRLPAIGDTGDTGDALRNVAAGLPGVAEALEQVPGWVRRPAARFMPRGAPPSRQIEERVLASLERAIRERSSRPPRRRRDRTERERSGSSTSVADEIAKLKALRESGALTDEQYTRAVERAIDSRD